MSGEAAGDEPPSPELRIAMLAVRLYAERHPRPSQVTMTQAGEMLGLTRQRMVNMVKDGQIKLNKCGMVPIEQVDAALQPA